MRFALVAGEQSGDRLAAGLIGELKKRFPNAQFEGVTGPLMRQAGCESLADMDALNLFGIAEIFSQIPRLLKLRKRLAEHFIAQPPDVFIGVDAPAFNTHLELLLKQAGIKTAHYVCPTVWAWRQGRTKKIKRATDKVLSIFPFEPKFLAPFGIEARFVGHPLADEIPMHSDLVQAQQQLGLDPNKRWVGLLPGSRASEVSRLGPLFLKTARWLSKRQSNLGFVVPLANDKVRQIFSHAMQSHDVDVVCVEGQAQTVMAASDCVLVASGTASLEALLVKTPMVVTYVVSEFNYFLARVLRLLKTECVSMPNLLAGTQIVPELIQHDAQPELIGAHALHLLNNPQACKQQLAAFQMIHEQLALGADQQAAKAIGEMVSA